MRQWGGGGGGGGSLSRVDEHQTDTHTHDRCYRSACCGVLFASCWCCWLPNVRPPLLEAGPPLFRNQSLDRSGHGQSCVPVAADPRLCHLQGGATLAQWLTTQRWSGEKKTCPRFADKKCQAHDGCDSQPVAW